MPDKTCPFCGRRFDASVQFCQDDGTPLTLAAGTVLAGRYEIDRELGRGAMGVVYLARERDLGDRSCAIKILRVPPGTRPRAMADAVSRLKREASLLGSLGSHPNLVTVYTAGQDEHGLAYIVMEYVEGETLKVKFAFGTPFAVPQAARIVRQVANGLDHAHAQGIVHRDLKPGNLILTRASASSAWVKIVDFGIAKAVGAEASDLTMPHHVVGTPRYMSPEQREGKPLDPRSDVFSLALIAAELLSDERGDADLGPFAEVPADLTTWPEDVKRVLARGLAFDPAERFASASEFADAFEAAVVGWEPDDEVGLGVAPPRPIPPPDGGQPSGEGGATSPVPRRPVGADPSWRWGRWVGGGVVAGIGLAAWALLALGADPPPPPGSAGERAAAMPAESLAVGLVPDSAGAAQEGEGPPGEGPGTADAEGRDTARPLPAEEPVRAVVDPDPGLYEAAVAALRSRVDPTDPDTSGLGDVVVEATRLIEASGVPDTLAVEARYLRAEARLMLGAVSDACADLETLRVAGTSLPWVAARYSRAVTALLALNCGAGQARP